MTRLSNYGSFTVNDNVIDEVDIQLRLVDLNYATFVASDYLEQGTTITIEYPASNLASILPVFTGIVTQCRKLARTEDGRTRYAIEAVEPAIELTNKYFTMTDDLQYTGLFISNISNDKTLGTFVSHILSGTDWKDISDAQYKDKTLVSGGASDDYIPSMGFSTSTIWNALNRLIINIFNYGLWFEYPVGQKCIRYGEFNKDVTSYPTPIDIKLQEHNINYVVDGVVVYADSDEIPPQYEGTVGPDKKVVAYRYSDCQSVDELKWVARKVYEDRNEPNVRYDIEFPVGFYNIREGDKIHIYDTSIGMEYRADGYGVKDVQITNEKTTAGVGSAKLTIFDILNDRLSLIDGNVLLLRPYEFDTNWINVYNSDDNNINTWGVMSSADLVIESETFMGDLFMTPSFGGAGIQNSGYFRIFSAIGHNEEEVTVAATNPLYMTGYDPHAFTGPFIPVYFPWTWKWVEIEVYYIFDDETEVGAIVDLDCVWGIIATVPYPPVTIVSLADVVDMGGTEYSSSIMSQNHHKWYVNSRDEMPHSYPIITVTPHEGFDNITLRDIIMKTTVFYEASEYPPVETTMLSGEIQMKIDDAMDWLTIYDSISGNPDDYVNKKYDMSEYIDYSAFETGRHTIYYRCRASGDEDHNGDCAVRIVGTYAGFGEKTRIIT